MKKPIHKIINKLLKKIKEKNNLPMLLLGLVTIIISTVLIGFTKTLLLLIAVIVICFAIKYGNIIIAKLTGKKVKDKKHHPKKRIIKLIGLAALGFGILVLIFGTAFAAFIVIKAPKFSADNLYRKEATTIYDSEGVIVAKIGSELRDKVTYDEIPEVFVNAIVATEDSRFFQHNGFDLARFIKASLGQLTGNSGAGGASTISMQVVKNNFTSSKQSILRKFTDIYISVFELEKHYTKKEILEFYVNAPYLGNNSYGIKQAAQNYFGKDLKDINLSEAALLAGIFQAPSAYDPYVYPDKAAKRRKTVLYLLKRHGYITEEEEKAANAIPIASLLKGSAGISASPYQGYIDVVVKEVETATGNDPYNVPMTIYTNMIKSKQDYINRVLSGELFKWENDFVQAGVAVVDVNNGAVVAIGNGRNRSGERIFNFATMIKRQIGSTAKPIFDYGPAMEYNNWSTYTLVLDDAHSYTGGVEIANVDNKVRGLITTRVALSASRNLPALRTFQQLDNKSILKFVESLGIKPEVSGGFIHEAHSIGAFNGASPIQLAAAYAAFSNGGYYNEPLAVNKIEYIDTGKVEKFSSTKTKVMSDSTAFMITDILRFGVDSGAIGGGKVAGLQIAAKSGTSNFDSATKKNYKLPSNAINDLWYSGYSTDYAMSMWYGYEKISAAHYNRFGISGNYRDKLYTAFAKGVFAGSRTTFTVPTSVVQIEVEKDTIPAMLPSANTPASMRITEYFKKGAEPTEVSPRFNTLSNVSGFKGVENGSNVDLTWNSVDTPNTVTSEYVAVLDEWRDKYLNIRAAYDASTLGTFGYNVYLKNNDGTLKWLGFTTNNYYSYTPTSSGSHTYVVKTSYSIFTSSQSSGSTVTVNSDVSAILITFVGASSMDWTKGTPWVDPGIQVMENGINVTSSATIVKTYYKTIGNTTTSSANGVDTSVTNVTRINYVVSYGGTSKTLNRIVSVK